jgi:hypothetical protein
MLERVQALAEKANEGELTESERRDYETYVHVGNIIAILQAKARLQLKQAEVRNGRSRAVQCCEYCRLEQRKVSARVFHIEHISSLVNIAAETKSRI